MSTTILNDPRVLDDEVLVQLCEIREHLPFKTSPATVNRWIRKGTGGVVLATALGGANRRYTSTRAIRDFLIAIQGKTVTPVRCENGAGVGMSKRELKAKMQKLGLRPQAGQPPVKQSQAAAPCKRAGVATQTQSNQRREGGL